MVIPEDASAVFSLALQNLNDIIEHNSAVTAKADALERVGVVEKTGAKTLGRWTLEDIDMVSERDGSWAREGLNIALMALHEQCSARASVQPGLYDAPNGSSQLQARAKSAREHFQATERHLGQFSREHNGAQAKPMLETSRSRACKPALLKARDVVVNHVP